MRDHAQFLEDCLREHGMEPDSVIQSSTENGQNIHVKKTVDGEPYLYVVSLSYRAEEKQEADSRLEMNARNISEQFYNEITDRVVFGGRKVQVCTYDGGWARCRVCGTRVDFEDTVSGPYMREAELSIPNPMPRSAKHVTEKLSDQQRLGLKIYLLGALRDECDARCPNSNTERFKYR